jgi:hypothetical protein
MKSRPSSAISADTLQNNPRVIFQLGIPPPTSEKFYRIPGHISTALLTAAAQMILVASSSA